MIAASAALLLAVQASAPTGPLADLRVGAENGVARVMLVCTERCAAAMTDGGIGNYRISGLSDDIALDLTDVPGLTAVRIEPDGDASLLSIVTQAEPRRVRLSRCAEDALCFDLDLAAPPPPTLASIAADLSALEERGAPKADFRGQLEAETGLDLGDAACARAEATLAADAWALDAFRHVALCRAAAGARGEADGLLARLEAYRPDPETARLRRLVALPTKERAATRLR